MADKPIKTSDIIDVGKDIEKVIAQFKKLETNVVKSLKNIKDSGAKLKGSVANIEKDIRGTVKETEKLTNSSSENQKQLKGQANALGKLSKEYNDAAKAAKNSDTVLSTLGKSLGDQKKRVALLKKEYETLDPTVDANKKRLSQLATAISRTKAEMKQLNDASNRVNKTFETSKGSYNDLVQQNSKIRSILNKLPPEFLETNKRAQELQKTFKENTATLKEFDANLGQNFRNVGNYGDAMGQLNGLAAQAGKFLGPLGLAGAVGFAAKAFYEATKQLEKNQKVVSKLFKGGEQDIKSYTAQATAISQVFDQEYNKVVMTANALTEKFGTSGSQSFELIEQALIRGADVNEDFLEQINEYSTFFSQAGIEAQGLVDILLLSEDKGVFSDKGLDTIKEADLRLRELTSSTRDAISGIGLSVEEIEKGLRDGSLSTFDVVQQVSEKLNELPDNAAEVGTAIADIFGGPGEDAGIEFLRGLKDINLELGDYEKNLTEGQKATKDYLDSQEELNAELLSFNANTDTLTTKLLTLWNNIKITGLEVLQDLAAAFTTVEERYESFKKQIEETSEIPVLEQQITELTKELDELFALKSAQDQNPAWIQRLREGSGSIESLDKNIALVTQKLKDLNGRIGAIRQDADDEELKETKTQVEELSKIDQEKARTRRAAQRELSAYLLEQEIKLLEETVANEKASINERIAASELIVDKQIELANIGKDGALDVTEKLLAEEKMLINAQNRDAVEAAERAGEARADALFGGFKVTDDSDFNAAIDLDLKNRLNALETAKNAELIGIEERLSNTKEKEEAIFQVEEAYRRKSLEATLEFLRKKADLFADSDEERIELQKEISVVELELARQINEDKLELASEYSEQLGTVEQLVTDMVESKYQNQILKLDEQQEQLDERLAYELSTTGDNEEAKQQIKEQFEAKQDEIDRKRAQAERRKATFQKLQAIFSIGVDTARAIGAQLPGLPITAPLIALIGTLGAAQIAAVGTQKVPAFKDGTDSAPGGPALVGEVGEELVYDERTGNAYLTPDKPTLMDIPEGAQVFDAITTRRMKQEMANESSKDKDFATQVNRRHNQTVASHNTVMAANMSRSENMNIDYNRLGKAVGKHLPPSQHIEFKEDGKVIVKTKFSDGTVKVNLNKSGEIINRSHPVYKQLQSVNKELSRLNKYTK